jgi:type II secretion system protein G
MFQLMFPLKNMSKNYYKNKGFTLVELLVVIAILGVLVTIGLVSFTSAQARGRDTQRKSDLKQVSSALEVYFNDHNAYPSSSNGRILGCPSTTSTACSWGTGQLTDGKTIYFKALPKDPINGSNYYYRSVSVDSVANQGFQLFARIENSQDAGCLGGNCGTHTDLPSGVSCGGVASCNFSITSPNTTPTE